MDFFVQFRQRLSSLEPSKIVPIISFRQSILEQVGQLLPNYYELDVPNFHGLVYVEPGEFEDDALQAAVERGHGTFLQAIRAENGKPKLYLLAREAWDTFGRQMVAPGSNCLRRYWIPCTGTTCPTLFLKRQAIVPSVCRRCTGPRKLYADTCSISIV
ncbi:hypothetical protein NPIL_519241 [Nephila pilipes]|uniref:Uncharacterized protein n=1 Tax=Nephila pilipes TaxID=299642 RepID=A0A8X6NH07_NEPPI|nr:hypothetical protein NPIL_519241 [Nephila pilipes]